MLINRVDQIYESELSIRLVLIDDNDLLNLNTPAQAWGPNGPCGAAPCYDEPDLDTRAGSRCSQKSGTVAGQIVGASAYDIGHVALGNDGGGIAGLGVVGGRQKAVGCTGLPEPDGDFYAVDYVAHEMGHQFGANHTFNGNEVQLRLRQPQRRHLASSRAAARRSWPTPASAGRTTCSRTATRTSRSAASARSTATRTRTCLAGRAAERLAGRLRQRRRLVHAGLERHRLRADRAGRELHAPRASRPRSRRRRGGLPGRP